MSEEYWKGATAKSEGIEKTKESLQTTRGADKEFKVRRGALWVAEIDHNRCHRYDVFSSWFRFKNFKLYYENGLRKSIRFLYLILLIKAQSFPDERCIIFCFSWNWKNIHYTPGTYREIEICFPSWTHRFVPEAKKTHVENDYRVSRKCDFWTWNHKMYCLETYVAFHKLYGSSSLHLFKSVFVRRNIWNGLQKLKTFSIL